MPELPEVETVRRGLVPVLEGRRLVRVTLRRADLRRPFPKGFVRALEGRRIERLGRRGKYLLAYLDDGGVLIVHLGRVDNPDLDELVADYVKTLRADGREAEAEALESRLADPRN